MLTLISILGLAILFLKVTWSTVAISMTLRYLQHGDSTTEHASWDDSVQLFVVIPLLREQSRLPELIRRFASFLAAFECLRLVLVTTHREELEASGKRVVTTKTFIESSVDFELVPSGRRFHFHYPGDSDVVSQQMSFAIDQLLSRGIANPQDYVLFYNADSAVSLDAIERLITFTRCRIPVAQQSALFLKNFTSLIQSRSYLAAGDALFQSGWTLTREIPRYLIGSGLVRWIPAPLWQCWLAHCVGHGLLIRIEILQIAGGFLPLSYGLEDSSLGYQLRAMGIAIRPVSYLESAEASKDLRTLLRQKSQWLRGPLCTIEYFTLARRRGAPRSRNSFLLIQGMYNGLKWGFGLFALAVLFYASMQSGHLGLFSVLYFAYCAVPLIGVSSALQSQGLSPMRWPLAMPTFLLFPLVPLLHGFSGLVGTYQIVWQVLRGRRFRQVKTESI